MSFFAAFTGKAQQKALDKGMAEGANLLDAGRKTAEGQINADVNRADSLYSGLGNEINRQYRENLGEINTSRNQALGYLNPYIASGGKANALYQDALGVNGLDRQQAFGANYAASDPFRAQNAQFANDQLMKLFNARGMSRGGMAAEAVARQNLARGSEDYGNYLSRLGQMYGQGQQAAGQAAGIASGYGGQRAALSQGYTNALANNAATRGQNFTGRGNALANLSYGNAQQVAGMNTNYANATAANKTTGINNLLNLGGTLGGMAISGMTPTASGATPFNSLFGGR